MNASHNYSYQRQLSKDYIAAL